ncbi:hypothetical protein CPC08DRAFT_227123 [Agrocybe pediades]|nr:hypothetical protein CPC08DRAFT_227123 [Agrocybe pediades]
MSNSVTLSSFVALVLSASSLVAAQAPPLATYPAVPLAKKGPFEYPDGIPFKVDTDTNLIRGLQKGYNICNGTTENQESLCQTSWLNSLEVGDIEGEMIAWCSKPGHGTRLIPEGALKGVQFMKTPDYVQVVGFIDQTQINMIDGDYGGEMDPHGADSRGNPMGGIVYSDKFTGKPIQGIEWHNFMGSNQFCFKVCDPAGPSAARYCEHIFDRIGCAFNAPNNAQKDVFESCEGESQDFPGVYTGADGAVTTYKQPAESLGPITTVPYVARVPVSSNCVKHESASIYTGLPKPTVSATSSSSSASQTAGGSGSAGLSTSRTTSAGPAQTGNPQNSSSNGRDSNNESGAERVVVFSGLAAFGVAFAALFLA